MKHIMKCNNRNDVLVKKKKNSTQYARTNATVAMETTNFQKLSSEKLEGHSSCGFLFNIEETVGVVRS